MKEVEWVRNLAPLIEAKLRKNDKRLSVLAGKKLSYANEIHGYRENGEPDSRCVNYETDLLITETSKDGNWKPRVIVEAKCRGSITTHDAITYSHKALTHRQVHPYLRYGILIGERGHYSLPGRLFRNGTQFDFMLSWAGAEPSKPEMNALIDILASEAAASRVMEEIIFENRKRGRRRYTVLHKELKVK